jgi:hypothetical protein
MTRDAPLSNIGPATSGIIQCLHLLADDAARLGLQRTHLAICQVLKICEAEGVEHEANATPARLHRVQ